MGLRELHLSQENTVCLFVLLTVHFGFKKKELIQLLQNLNIKRACVHFIIVSLCVRVYKRVRKQFCSALFGSTSVHFF